MKFFSIVIYDPALVHLFVIEFILIFGDYFYTMESVVDFNFIIFKNCHAFKFGAIISSGFIILLRARKQINDSKFLSFLTLSLNNLIILHLLNLTGIDFQNSKLLISLIIIHFLFFRKKNIPFSKLICFVIFITLISLIPKRGIISTIIISRNIIASLIISLAFVIKNKNKLNIELLSYQILNNSSKAIFTFDSDFSITFMNEKCKKYVRKNIIPFNLDLKLLFKNCFINKLTYCDILKIQNFFDFFNLHMIIIKYPLNSSEFTNVEIQNIQMLLDTVRFIYSLKLNGSSHEFVIEINKSVKKSSNLIKKEYDGNTLNTLRTISHDLRTPINGIIGSLSLLIDMIEEKCKDFANIALVSSKLLYNNINMMVDHSLIMHSQFKPSFAFAPLQAIRNRIEELFKKKAKMNDIDFKIFNENPPFEFQIEYERIAQVLINLVNNSINFTSVGFVHLLMKFEQSILSFEVVDSGIGMSQLWIDILLSRSNFSSKLEESESQGQFGLGIKTSNMILKFLGSELKIFSTPNKGTRISFDLKLLPDQIKTADQLKDDDTVVNFTVEKNYCQFAAQKVAVGTVQKVIRDNSFTFPLNLNSPFNLENKEETKGYPENKDYNSKAIEKNSEESDLQEDSNQSIINDYVHSHTLSLSRIRLIPNEIYPKRDYSVNAPLNHSKYFNSKNHPNFLKRTQLIEKPIPIILVVDDEPFNRCVLKNLILKNFKVKVSEARNGKEAVKEVKKQINHIKLIFMDILMPVMDGYQATAEIKKFTLKHKESITIIALTSFPAEIEKVKCLKAGMNDFMNKPITKMQLIECFEQHLNFVERKNND